MTDRYAPYGLPWSEVPAWFATEAAQLSPLTGEPYIKPGSVSVAENYASCTWRGFQESQRWLERGTCQQCGQGFVKCDYHEGSDWQTTGRAFHGLLICNTCDSSNRSERSRVTSKRYRDKARQVQPAKPCKQCGALFRPKRSTGLFCSDLCRIHNHRGCVNWSS